MGLVVLVGIVTAFGPAAGPAGAQTTTTTIEDTAVGTGDNQVSYSGAWSVCTGCGPATANRSFRYSYASGATITIRFVGTHITVHGIKNPLGGFAAFALDGGTPTTVDTYASASVVAQQYSSAALPPGTHTLTIRNVHQRGPASSNYYVGFDRAEVLNETVTPPPPTTFTIEDTAVGTGINQVSYAGGWSVCTGCGPATPNRSFRYSYDSGSIATIRFAGSQISVYGIQNPLGGFAAFSIDGGTPTVTDFFLDASAVVLNYSSPQLSEGVHTLSIANVRQRSGASSNYYVGFDRAVVGGPTVPPPPPATPPVTVEDTAVGTGANQVSYAGNWTQCVGCVHVSPNNSVRTSTNAGAAATIRFAGIQANIYGVKGPDGGLATVSVDGGPTQSIDTYGPSPSITLLYSSERLAQGNHFITLTNLGQRNSSSSGFAVGLDRVEVPAGLTSPPDLPPWTGPRSGKPWISGTYPDPVMNPANIDAFCAWRGAPCDFALLYTTRNNWVNVTQPTSLLQTFAPWPGRLIIATPPFPENIGASLSTCATGAYNSYWRNFGNILNTFGRQDSIIRLGWEANGNWYQWSATNPTAFINCFRQVVDSIRATAEPDPIISWSLNAHYSQNPPSHNAIDMYPGDPWVDVVGLDAYDAWPASRTKAEFDAQATAVGGISYWYNFARAHNKLFGIGEWGVVSGNGTNGGGDNPNFIQWMHDWFAEHAGKGFAYEFYFGNCDPGNVGSNLYRPLGPGCVFRNPNAAARYQQLWRRT
ncbi:glycoside hydrolase family 26 protein [Frankia sp. EI5c]|uniref:glycoside hydrolase family 26 protein n=1 Tax=Frankia sp. EI5c TaxID=683316 RepID=UPI001F5BF436|nr:glycosyl hydrolase [Frankia sp. EI5c]